jgi:inosine-uridine nucleoside N-ribohydrolase
MGEERPLLGARRRREPLRWPAERDACHRVLPVGRRPDANPRAIEIISRTGRASDGLTIVAIGPLTNLATALVADPAGADRLEKVVVMDGAFEVAGNVTPTAEFNFFMEPEAAHIVLESGVRPVLVGLDVCTRTHLTSRQIAATDFRSELERFVQCSCASWLPAMDASEDQGPHLYDTLAAASAFWPRVAHRRGGVRPDRDRKRSGSRYQPRLAFGPAVSVVAPEQRR